MTILESIEQLLKFQNSCTISQISKVSSIKQAEVLVCINTNESLLRIDKEKGKIVGFRNIKDWNRSKLYSTGGLFKSSLINYGSASELSYAGNKAEHLRHSYWCGGFGDSYEIHPILDTPENRANMSELGIKEWDSVADAKLEDFWKE